MKNWSLNNLNAFLLQCIAFALPLYQKVLAPLIVLWSLSSIINIFVLKLKLDKNKALLSLISFFVFLAVGLFWTENMKAGTFDLEVKMSLFVFPFLFLFIKTKENSLKNIIRVLGLGILIFFIMGLYYGINRYLKDDTLYYLFYSRLTPKVHPSYMSMYIVTVAMVTLYYLKKGVCVFYSKGLTISVLLFLFVVNIMILSKIGIITFFFLIIFYVLTWMYEKRKIKQGVLILLSMIALIVMSYKKIEFIKYRVDELVTSFNSKSENSSGVRFFIWKHAATLIKEKPILGYGTGDVKDELVKKYKLSNLTVAFERKYNAHNQFFQILISSGIVGLFLFLMSAYFGAKSNPLIFQFVIITIIFMTVESILENQAGTIFFGLFFSLLSQKSLKKA